jgi:hypothetical protein
MRIDSSGDVGIGTVSPSSKLDVNGDVTITDKIIHSGDTNTSIRFPANDTFTVETAGSERMRINSSGNVGIGTSSPTHSLSVENGTGSHVKLTRTGVNSFELGVVSGNALVFYDNGTERMRITSSGNVGIGTNSPSSKLDVNGDVTTNNIYVGDGSAAAPSFAFEADTNTGLYRRTADELNISVGGSENFRFVGDHGYSSSGTGTNLSQVGSGYTTVTSITFTAKSTTALAVGMIRGYSASALSYIYSYVNIGGTSGKVAAGQYSNLASNGNETLTPLVMVTGLTVGASYTAYLYGANGGSITNSYDFELAIYS